MIVNGGKKFIQDFLAGATEWVTGVERYMAAGTSTDSNAGVTGPVVGTGVASDGSWQGPAGSDFKLSTEITTTRPECNFTVGANGTVHVQAQFTDDNFVSGATESYDLFEFGLFLHPTNVPGNSPVDYPNANNKRDAMVMRTVNVYLDVTEYKTWAYVKEPGVPLIINFDIIDFGA